MQDLGVHHGRSRVSSGQPNVESQHSVESEPAADSIARLPDKELHQYSAYLSPVDSASNATDCEGDVAKIKAGAAISAVEINQPNAEVRHRPRPWRTTFFRFGPLSGIFCMLLALTSIVASLGILVASNGAPIQSWTAPPSTYLAICTAIANLGLRYACIQGVVIAWWYRASRGSTLASLHYDWRSGTTLRGALTAGRHMGLLGLACIFSTLVVMDGPLLQRANTVINVPFTTQTVPLKISMAPEIPHDFTGVWTTTQNMGVSYWWSPAFNSTVPTGNGSAPNNVIPMAGQTDVNTRLSMLFESDAPLSGVVNGCTGTCTAKLRAPALSVTSCKTHVHPVNYHHVPYSNVTAGLISAAPSLDQEGFFVSIGLQVDKRESIYVITGTAETEQCRGTLTYHACTLEAAIGEYDILIRDTTAVLQDPGHPAIIALANNANVNHTYEHSLLGYKSTLAQIVELASEKFESYVAFYRIPGDKDQVTGASVGTGSDPYVRNDDSACPSFSDPRPDVMRDLNKLMVWTGAIAASQNASYRSDLEARMDPGLRMDTTVTGFRQGDHSVFHTDFGYFVAAVLVEFICIALVAPTYWGWWQIGRAVSFSPLEIAKAFESPLLANCDSNSSGRDVAKAVGNTSVHYGAVRGGSSGEEAKLAFAHAGFVCPPRPNVRFGA